MNELPSLRIDRLKYKQNDISMLRMDLIDPVVSGNKWFKLKHNLLEAKERGFDKVLTFGGAFSNHIYATAGAGKKLGLKCVGVIRGEETLPLNATLSFSRKQGMHLHYMDRSTYKRKYSTDVIARLKDIFGDFYLIPEGGSNELALKGVEEAVKAVSHHYELWTVPVGTGGTLAGLIGGLNDSSPILGFSALKGAEGGLENDVIDLLRKGGIDNLRDWSINHDFHLGGYARFTKELYQFIRFFQKEYNILLDPIYTGKMMFGIFTLADQGLLGHSNILAVHTGGLQGWNGIKERYPFVDPSLPLDG